MNSHLPKPRGAALRLPSWRVVVPCCYADCEATTESTAYARVGGKVFFKMPPGWAHEDVRGYDPSYMRAHLREEWDSGYRCPEHPEDKFPGPFYEDEDEDDE